MISTDADPEQVARDTPWMLRALELARKGIALCSPNPAVGCVILNSRGALAGEGWHEYRQRDHAEIVALRAAGQLARNGVAYVTLEPCSHTGRTGPCSTALIAAGVARVVIATHDPNPQVSGSGIAALREAGVQVSVGICRSPAQRLNEGFARWIQTRRPFVEMKVAMSLDGRIAPPPGTHSGRQPFWITGPAARAAVQPLRRPADAVLTGINTVLADDPLLTDRSGRPRRRPLLRVILDSSLRMPLDSRMLTTAENDLLIFTVSQDKAKREELLSRGALVEVLPPASVAHREHPASSPSGLPTAPSSPASGNDPRSATVPLDQVLARLGELEILALLTETGTCLNSALLSDGFVDRIRIFVSPQLMGADAVPAFQHIKAPLSLPDSALERFDQDFCVNSLLRDPWAFASRT